MKNSNRMYLTAEEVAEILGVSKAYAYKVIRNLNDELVPCKVQNCIKIILICFWDMILFLKRSDQYAKEKI